MAKARPQSISWLPWWLRGPIGRWVVRSVFLLAAVAALLAGVIGLSHWARERIRDQEQYLVEFREIRVEPAPPAGMDLEAFLDELQFCFQELRCRC